MKKIIEWIFKTTEFKSVKIKEEAGVFSSFMGIILNILLSIVKLGIGFYTGSIAIMSDAFNNISDTGSSVIAYIGYKVSSKPADKDHPFGHGRAEYLASLFIGISILFVGINLLQTSFDKVLHPQPLIFSWWVVIVLLCSILVKVWMAAFNKTLGQLCNSSVMMAIYQDSLNDVMATSATMIAYFLSPYSSLPIDGVMGMLVSFVILYAGFEMIKDTLDTLLGKPVDNEIVDQIISILKNEAEILGVHDLILHSYGPNKVMGSVHAEVNSEGNVLEIHDMIDELERQVMEELNVLLTIHTDPIEVNNETVNHVKKLMNNILNELDKDLHFHDLRLVSGPTHTNIIFDLVIPFDNALSSEEIQCHIDERLSHEPIKYYVVMTLEHDYH